MNNPFANFPFNKAPKGPEKKKKDKAEEDTPPSPGRREFIRRTAQAVAGAALIGLEYGPSDLFRTGGSESIDPSQYEDFDHRWYVEYSTGVLVGHKLGGLYTAYTAIDGVVEESEQINFANQLDNMWAVKITKSSDNVAVPGVAEALTKEYRENKVEHLTLNDYVKRIEGIIGEIKEAPEFWEKIGEIKDLNPEELALAKAISSSIDGKDLVAYMMTELMPTKHGLLNKEVTDFLLRNAGREYIESIPALNDAKTSFGPYQFTEYAVYHADETRGASITNMALPPDKRIPGSVGKLRGDDHHKAAYLFAIDNIANLVKMSSRIGKRDVLSRVWRKKHLEIVQIIATAHHGPYAVIDGIPLRNGKRKAGIAERWLANNARRDFIVSGYGNYKTYAQKTKANFTALHSSRKLAPKKSILQESDSSSWDKIPPPLQGTPQSHAAERAAAKKWDLDDMSTDEVVERMGKKGFLVRMPRRGNGFFVDEIGIERGIRYPGKRENLYNTRPWVKKFIEKEAELFAKAFPGAKFKVTALTRSKEYQTWLRTLNGNASPTSIHLTGAVVDIGKYLTPNATSREKRERMSPAQLEYMRKRLQILEAQGLVLATEEKAQATFHIFVTPEY